MKTIFLFLCIVACAAASNITYFLNLSFETECPGDIVYVTAIASNDEPVADAELRLVLHYPYQGLRALKHTDEQGKTFFEITKPGEYRVYIKAEGYNYDDFVEFNYPEMCPPPPPEEFDVSIEPDCNESLLKITVTENEQPLEDVSIDVGPFSSLTGSTGSVVFPLEEGIITIKANFSGYTYKEIVVDINCTPPECLSNDDCTFNQYCYDEKCINISGTCGYPENHTWIEYECCNDSDCETNFECQNNTCIELPPPPNITNITENISTNETEIPEQEKEEVCIAALLPLFLLWKISGLSG